MTRFIKKDIGVACTINTEIGAVLAALRNSCEISTSEDYYYHDAAAQQIQSLKSLRSFIFNTQQEWKYMDPSIYLSPFLDIIQADEIPASATSVALSSVLKLTRLEIFDEKTPGAKEAMNALVTASTSCRLERSDPVSEEGVLMKILQLLTGIMTHPASCLLRDQSVCTVINTCFQVVQQSATKGNLLQRTAKHTMHEITQMVFSKLNDIEVRVGENSESDSEDIDDDDAEGRLRCGFGLRCVVDIFHFLCSLLNVVQTVEIDGVVSQNADEDIQIFALVLISTALELSGDGFGKHPKLLRMIRDDLFHHLIHYGTRSSSFILSMICSTVLNAYHFLRRSLRLQLEAFFSFVLFRIASFGGSIQFQEAALEGIINLCRQPMFLIETYVNYDCALTCGNLFEELGRLLCKLSFPMVNPLTTLQLQAFEGLVIVIQAIADNIKKAGEKAEFDPYPVEITEYSPFWEEPVRDEDDLEEWIDTLRFRKAQKRKIMIAGTHFNQDEKKGLEYLKLSHLVPTPPSAKAYAYFFRFTPRLNKTAMGDYLGDPDEFHLQVLNEFTNLFDFTGMILDSALRTYLETFRLPGESQKIQRILETFSERFYDQQSSELFETKDAVFILCYSVIMLNTDQHNPQVKKKMTEDEFIRNNRAINNGKDLPREYLTELFQSIASNAITIFGQSGFSVEMNPSRWMQLVSRSKAIQPFIACEYDHRLGRDMFASIAGPTVAAFCAVFEHADDEEILNECIEGVVSIAKIAQHGLEDILDEILASFCKFTTLLNPYASIEETLYIFANDLKPRMATLAVFTIANKFGESIRGAWRNIIDCLLKLKRLKLLPTPVVDFDSLNQRSHLRSGSGSIFSSCKGNSITKFSHLVLDRDDDSSLVLGGSEFEQNLKVIQQCRIGNIFKNSSKFSIDTLLNLGRSLIFAAAGKGQKFTTAVEEEEIIGFCWDLIVAIGFSNLGRFSEIWPAYNEYLISVAQFSFFSPVPFAEKAVLVLFKLCIKILSTLQEDKYSEELIFKSINLMWKFDKEILDTCCDFILQSVCKIFYEYIGNVQTQLGWKTLIHLLSVTGRHTETYDQGVEAVIWILSEDSHLNSLNYAYCIDCAFGFVALRGSDVDKNIHIMDMMANSVNLLVQWTREYYSDPTHLMSNSSIASNPSEDNYKSSNFTLNLFIKLGESLRKTSLARREEVRNNAIASLKKSFQLAEGLEMTSTVCINCFNYVIFAMVDDLHEKMLEYSRRDNAEREMRSMEGTLKYAMELLTDVLLQYLHIISENQGFRTFWLGILRRMDTCMKADLGIHGQSRMQDVVPELLKKIIASMKDTEILVPKENDDLWEITYIQIQWIAPSIKGELFPDVI